jgi:hypothetical protein
MDDARCGSGTSLWGPAVGFVSALLLSDNRDYGGRFEWGIFWLFALIVPTILAAFILLISWVVSPPRSRRHRR